jgi:hypothetical protein
MNDDHFFDLAMKAIAKQASLDEQAELDGLLLRQPELQAEFDRLKADARLAKEVLPLLDAAKATAGEVPGYAYARLQTKVRETFKGQEAAPKRKSGVWQWWLGLAGATAVVAFFFFSSPAPVIQVAMLDSVGGVRGSASNLVAVIEQTWAKSRVQEYSESADLKRWLAEWPGDRVVKIVYDRDAQEVRVSGRLKGKAPFEKTFPVDLEKNLPAVLEAAQKYIKEQVR